MTTTGRLARFLAAVLLTLSGSLAAAQGVVISQVYGGGGSTGAPYSNDFVEIFNRGSAAVDLAGWSIQYASATGTGSFAANPMVALAGSLGPGQYRLVSLASGSTGSALPAADFTGSTNLSGSAGKVALVSTGGGLACNGGSTPCGAAELARIADLVGYGGANFFETSPAPALSAATAALRSGAGCSDTNNNAVDFSAAAPAPRNSASPANDCVPVSAPIVATCPALTLAADAGGEGPVGASDADGIVDSVAAVGSWPAGLALGPLTTATGVGGSAGASVVVATSTPAGSYTVTLRWGNNQAQTTDCTVLVNIASLTRIPTIQGSGTTSPIAGQRVLTEGVVTRLTNNGFFLQDRDGDGDPATSDGVFVFTGAAPTVAPNTLVRLSASVTEFNTGASTNAQTAANPLTELTSISGLTLRQSGVSVTAVPVDLLDPALDLERVEGMLVTLNGPLTVSQNFFLGRFGQLTLSAGGRLETPTNRLRPGAAALALAQQNARRSVLLDDATSLQNPNPIPYIGAGNTVRAGDSVAAITGVIDYGLATASSAGLASYRIQPAAVPAFTRDNARSAAPDPVGGNLKVASFNVLNFFTTFADGTTADGQSGQGCALGGVVAAGNCRGASNLLEFTRQRDKLVEALAAIDADVLGLIELQNNGAVAPRALADALNARLGAALYDIVPDPATGTGSDAIKVGMLYKPGRVSRVGESLADTDPVHNRPPLAQAYAAPNGERFSVVVNHFKSKGCEDATGLDLDQGDLQGCYNDRRVRQARALRTFVEGLQAVAGSDAVLVLGDLNAYAQEDPVHELTAVAGLRDEIARFSVFGYSYVFDGAAGRLDHALSTPALSAKVTGATEWHINADEPSVLDYNLEFKPQDLYSVSPYRTSDHDPVVVGLNLVKTIDGTRRPEVIAGTPGDDVITGGRGPDLVSGGGGADVFRFLAVGGGVDVITDFLPADDRIDLRPLLGSSGGDPTLSGRARLLPIGRSCLVQVYAGPMPRRAAFRTLAVLWGVPCSSIVPARDLLY